MIRFLLFVVALGYIIYYEKSFVNLFFKVIIFCYLILFIDSLIQYFFEKNILNFKIIDTGRISSFFQDELVMGSYTLRLFPVFITIIFFKNFLIRVVVFLILSGDILNSIFNVCFCFLFSINFLKRKFLFLSIYFNSIWYNFYKSNEKQDLLIMFVFRKIRTIN